MKKETVPLSRRDIKLFSHDLKSWYYKTCYNKGEKPVGIFLLAITRRMKAVKKLILTEKWHINMLIWYRTYLTSALRVSVCILTGLGSCITLLAEATLSYPSWKDRACLISLSYFTCTLLCLGFLQIHFSQQEKSQGTYQEYWESWQWPFLSYSRD